jgi:glutamyl-tRNA(Gln) amidotransferase subunit D
LGQAPARDSENNWLPTIKKTIEKGVIICGAPQTIFGRLNPNVYSTGIDLQKTGLIFLEDMLPEVAFVKLGWILGHNSWIKEKKIEKNERKFIRRI